MSVIIKVPGFSYDEGDKKKSKVFIYSGDALIIILFCTSRSWKINGH